MFAEPVEVVEEFFFVTIDVKNQTVRACEEGISLTSNSLSVLCVKILKI